ncbi:pirin family protein [Cellulophaga sp. E16_2]|uniref:Pirin domain protein n=1 Tax=Cellulophaga algicola (strain DSM 14237 / IC166 / ACAM 630) TaxID=688270 RepID=E6X660_CELAD|nr:MULTISPECIES: pirin family protein [Cellulophaga]ADV50619.1 Pirin domain protein [Cellulophaga algicola DSM 14237]MBO0593006.1 pirin family protein [Cellulophaga sp. E16_2]
MSKIKSIFPLGFPWQTQDPFLFCVYHSDHYPEGNEELGPKASLEGRTLGNDFTLKDGWRMYHGKKVPGFPAHPHRGFETITIVNKGFCDHSDSLGAAGRFGMGDVQWMTAGSGVQHSEMFPLLSTDKENPLEMFQIWLNLPQKNKFAAPHFAMLWHEEIPILKTETSTVKVIAGSYNTLEALDPAPNSWAADRANDVAIWNIQVAAESTYILPKAKNDIPRMLYFYEGDTVEIEGRTLTPNHGISVDALESLEIKVRGKNAHFLMLQGKPIDEPIAKYGPFVMNSDEEIQEAMEEYQRTQFGGWPWPDAANVHDKSKGRFAKYPDGNIVEK